MKVGIGDVNVGTGVGVNVGTGVEVRVGGGVEVEVGARVRVGVAVSGTDQATAQTLLTAADRAMYRVKRRRVKA